MTLLPSPTLLPSENLVPGGGYAGAMGATPDPPEAVTGMLATVEELQARIRTAGTVSAGAQLDVAELERLLAGASDRIVEQRPERTLAPAGSAAAPVEVSFAIVPPQRIVQVPDLRQVVSIELRDLNTGAALTVPPYTLRRRPREACALWVRFAYPLTVEGELVIRGVWGPAGVKADGDLTKPKPSVHDACLVWAARAWHNRTARFADTMQDPAGAVASYFRNLPPDVKATLDALEVPGL